MASSSPARPHWALPISLKWEISTRTPVASPTRIISARASKAPRFSLRICTASVRSCFLQTRASAMISPVSQKLPGG